MHRAITPPYVLTPCVQIVLTTYNDGHFSRLIRKNNNIVISSDFDPLSVEFNFQKTLNQKVDFVYPLILDLANPSPDMGWANKERDSFIHRAQSDLTIVLALIHHLVISNNVPFENVAKFFTTITDWLIIEFVPKSDSQVQIMLAGRPYEFSDYDQTHFEQGFKKHFKVLQAERIEGTDRTMYLLRKCLQN